MLDASGIITNWNAGAERIKGYKAAEIVGQHFSTFYTEEDLAAGLPARALATALREGKFEGEGWRRRKDGTRFWASVVIDAIYDDAGQLTGFAKITRDITERREAQLALERTRAALQHSQKMEAIGQLTGGIAHDFNNLLTVIVNNLDLLGRNLPAHDRALLDSTQRAAERGAKLTQQLLAFARRQPLRPAQHNLDEVIQGFEAVLRRACVEAVELDLQLAGGRPLVDIDAAQFESALLNLTVNACDAMPDGGRLTLASRWMDLDGDAAGALGGNLKPGPYIVVTVTDTGSGMPAGVAERAFEPFFTTKEIGRGTGLGLSQVYGFVSQTGGHVTLSSTEGKGTSISLYLPASEAAAPPAEEHGARPPRAAETALIVEDDFLVLESAAQLFRSLGYDVLTAGDGPSALALLEQQPHIDVLFTDVAMPKGMNGVELARRVARLRPGTRILLASGYPPAELTAQHGVFDEFSFISKPYRWTEVAEKLRGLRAA
jgi:PAS domain S-box-containing protein